MASTVSGPDTGLKPSYRGKVRDLYDLGDKLLLVATDRISAFDVVLSPAVPDKGRILTQISAYWFRETRSIVPNHVLTHDLAEIQKALPKGAYLDLDDFTRRASEAEVAGFFRAVAETARKLGLVEGGYRILANLGRDARQEVFHFHIHIFGGRDLGGMIRRPD